MPFHVSSAVPWLVRDGVGQLPGDFIDVIHERWAEDYDLLERHRGYAQWLFPIHEKGRNADAQPLQRHESETMRGSKEVMHRVLLSYRMMLRFYGAELADQATGALRLAGNYQARFQNLNRSHPYRFEPVLSVSELFRSPGLITIS
jgi:hypothetical protein